MQLNGTMAPALREYGWNVRSVEEIFGNTGVPDVQINQLANQINAKVITGDKGRKLGEGFGTNRIPTSEKMKNPATIHKILSSYKF